MEQTFRFPKPQKKLTNAEQRSYYLKRTKDTDLAKLKASLWEVFSIFIRLRDCLLTTGTIYYLHCFTCGARTAFKKAEAGHFLAGRGNAILFDERGVHGQCHECNVDLHGSPKAYEEKMIAMYGQAIVDELKALKGKAYKFTKDQLAFAIDDYTEKNTRLRKLVIPKGYTLKGIS